MSPEAIQGGSSNPLGGPPLKVGRPSDVWSLGCILYQILGCILYTTRWEGEKGESGSKAEPELHPVPGGRVKGGHLRQILGCILYQVRRGTGWGGSKTDPGMHPVPGGREGEEKGGDLMQIVTCAKTVPALLQSSGSAACIRSGSAQCCCSCSAMLVAHARARCSCAATPAAGADGVWSDTLCRHPLHPQDECHLQPQPRHPLRSLCQPGCCRCHGALPGPQPSHAHHHSGEQASKQKQASCTHVTMPMSKQASKSRRRTRTTMPVSKQEDLRKGEEFRSSQTHLHA
eukprot:1156499-Pelagomonas_calceolata.AAC.11